VAVAAVEPRLAFAPLPERPAWLQEPEPNPQLSADLLEMLAHSFQVDFAAQVSRWDSARREPARSPPAVAEERLLCPELAEYWPLATLGPGGSALGVTFAGDSVFGARL